MEKKLFFCERLCKKHQLLSEKIYRELQQACRVTSRVRSDEIKNRQRFLIELSFLSECTPKAPPSFL